MKYGEVLKVTIVVRDQVVLLTLSQRRENIGKKTLHTREIQLVLKQMKCLVDQQSNTLEQMESELPEEENKIVASKE